VTARRPDRTKGRFHAVFWDWCARGELRLQRCSHCHHITWPVAPVCESCGRPDLVWERMTGRGTVVGWNRFDQDYFGGLLPLPYDTLLVELEERQLFITNPLGFTIDDVSPGMPVKVAFIAVEDSAGPFMLPVFERY
jgi:uncharacterized OB-fold protein